MDGVFAFLLLLSLACLVVGLVKPTVFRKLFKNKANRKIVGLTFSSLFVLFFVLTGVTSGAPHTNTNPAKPKVSARVITTKTITTTQPIVYTTTTEQDASLAQGTTSVKTQGVNGVQTQTWTVTYTNGVETGRKLVSTVVTTQPVNKVVEQGTYVAAPSATTPDNCTNGTYVNSAGNTVCSPETASSAPAGATAQCADGTYSFSQSRSGTCSHHGGVAQWLN